jgi:hypothetical protein
VADKPRRKRFSLAPAYLGSLVGSVQASMIEFVPVLVQRRGPEVLTPELERAYLICTELAERGVAPLYLGAGIAIVGILSVFCIPVLRYFWWIVLLLAVAGVVWLLSSVFEAVM